MAVSLLGFCWDVSSSHARGAAMAPQVIRSLLRSGASNPYSFRGVDTEGVIEREVFPALSDEAEVCRGQITNAVKAELADGFVPLSLGGDHSITLPILRAIREAQGAVNVLQVDAHPDLYEDLDGDRYSHACPFARALEEGCIGTLVQVGIRSATPEQIEKAKEHDVLVLGPEGVEAVPDEFLATPLYMSIDLDGLDPAFAPGVSHPEPGGLSSRELLRLIGRIQGPLVGADIVELNPERDQGLLTAGLAVRLLKELAAKSTETR
jgi:agmatinase